jgi:hypothetical protein
MHAKPSAETIKFRRRPIKRRLNKRTIEGLDLPRDEPNGKPGRIWVYDNETPPPSSPQAAARAAEGRRVPRLATKLPAYPSAQEDYQQL